MKRPWAAVLLVAAWVMPALGSTPAEAAAIAEQDCRRLPDGARQYARYLWAGMWDAKVLPIRYQAANLLIHSNSREPELAPPVRITADVWRLDVRNYGWDPKVFEKLAEVDPYFHAKAEFVAVLAAPVAQVAAQAVPVVGKEATATQDTQAYSDEAMSQVKGTIPKGLVLKVEQAKDGKVALTASVGTVWALQGAFSYPEPEKPAPPPAPKEAPAQAAFRQRSEIGGKALANLVVLTQSQTPLLRADWFVAQISRQIDLNDQKIVGTYDFLQIKEEKDLEELAGIDRKVAQKLRREVDAILLKSGVALKGRQVACVSPGYWESRDVNNVLAAQNPVRQRGKDYKPKAKEVYFRLPNDLWGTAAVNAVNGKLADVVPQNIALDRKSTSNDLNIHPCLSCIRCHVEGLRPLNDWARQFYANPPGDTKLAVPVDYDKYKELRALYLGPLFDRYEDDQRVYARALLRLTGLTPEAAAKAVRDLWQEYADADVTGEQLARELGVSHAHMLAGFKYYAAREAVQNAKVTKPKGFIDDILANYLKDPEFATPRDYIQEVWPLAVVALQGYQPTEQELKAAQGTLKQTEEKPRQAQIRRAPQQEATRPKANPTEEGEAGTAFGDWNRKGDW